jgi:trehalose-phosphatase
MLTWEVLNTLRENLSRLVWFFDYDGTLCPHYEIWQDQHYDAERIYKCVKKMATHSRGAFWNTGRRIHSLGGVSEKFLEFSGYFVHGTFFWDSQKQSSIQWGESLPEEFVKNIEKEVARWAHAKLEIKPTALRLTVPQAQFRQQVNAQFENLKIEIPQGWHWYEGPRGIELLRTDFNKGTAVHQCLLDCFSTERVIPVAVGDDAMDKFAVQVCLKFGGYAILVGDNCGWITEIPHNPKQIFYLETPSDVLDFCESL